MGTLPRERLEADVKQALRAGEKERLQALRLLLTDVKNKKIELGREVEEQEFLALVRKAIKQRREAAHQFRDGGRAELADKELREAQILDAYLPPQAEEEDIRRAVRDLVSERGLSGPGDMGTVMQEMMRRFAGSADGATVNRIAREVLSGQGD